MKPTAGRDLRDADRRLKRGQRILAETLQGAQIPDHGIFPGLGYRPSVHGEEPVAVLIPVNSFRLITEKIVRGIFFIEEKKFIESPYQIEFFALDDEPALFWKQVIERFGQVYAREPGIIVHRAVTPEDGISSLFEITFWQHFKTYASVTTEEKNK